MEGYRLDLDNFCGLLSKNNVEYLIIGGLAVNYHGFQRATGDIDIWYNPTKKNFEHLLEAIKDFGFDITDIRSLRSYEEKGVIRLPLDRYSIELLAIIDGKFSFQSAYEKAETVKIIEQSGKIISYEFLIENKIMSRRPKDLEDIRQLEIRRLKKDSDR